MTDSRFNLVMLKWRYVKTGACEFCDDPVAELRTPETDRPIRVLGSPLFCPRCQNWLESELRVAGADRIDVIVEAARRR